MNHSLQQQQKNPKRAYKETTTRNREQAGVIFIFFLLFIEIEFLWVFLCFCICGFRCDWLLLLKFHQFLALSFFNKILHGINPEKFLQFLPYIIWPWKGPIEWKVRGPLGTQFIYMWLETVFVFHKNIVNDITFYISFRRIKKTFYSKISVKDHRQTYESASPSLPCLITKNCSVATRLQAVQPT